MFETIFSVLDLVEDSIWTYLCFPMIMIFGLYFSVKSGFFQILKFPAVVKNFLGFAKEHESSQARGVHPLKAFFAAVGGCVGVGNIVGICTAVQVGGPGALFWIWVTAILGTTLKYAEVYLGVRYREPNAEGGYNGGPMYFLRRAFKTPVFATLSAFFLCIYGVEVFQFSIVVQSVSNNWSMNPYIITATLLILVMFAGSGGVRRVGNISSWIVPIFVVLYIGMGSWVLLNHLADLPGVMASVFTSAFSGHAAVGGFIGSSMMMAISQGIRRGCYTGDVGVGYASIINAETTAQNPAKQASLEVLGIFMDTFMICTTSVVMILATGVWHESMDASMLVQTALGQHFPYMHLFMPFFLFLLGYSTINAYFCAGLKCADYLSPRFGRKLYYVYAVVALTVFSFVDATQSQSLMAITGGVLLVINLMGIFRLRNEVAYNFADETVLNSAT